MYFPFLRGRQFDLIAIRELLEMKLIDENIVPIIEPVKLNSTLINTITAFIDQEREILVLQNPRVGSFEKELEGHDLYDKYITVLKSPYVTITHNIEEHSKDILSILASSLGKELSSIAVLHSDYEKLKVYNDIFSSFNPKYNIISDNKMLRRRLQDKNLVVLQDCFIKQKNNKDYLKNDDEFFSEEHLYFKDDNLKGFSDYSIVGDQYTEGGFAPFAIAIHIIYTKYNEEYDEKILRVRHFVSDSNDDIRDPALKCVEALRKLNAWYEDKKEAELNTYAMNQLISHYENGSYPGLPSLKKLSIMHHIELVNTILRGK